MHVYGLAHCVGPVQPLPPHCPYCRADPGFAIIGVVLGVDLVLELTCFVVVVEPPPPPLLLVFVTLKIAFSSISNRSV
jgi:hypothetical protein